MILTSTSIKYNKEIPLKHTKFGEDVSPDLEWSEYPKETKSFAIIVEDPDAPQGTWTHWLLYDIQRDGKSMSIKQGMPHKKILKNGTKQGINDFSEIGYGGPKPPSGTHVYRFKIYALNENLDLETELKRKELFNTIKSHIIDMAKIESYFTKP